MKLVSLLLLTALWIFVALFLLSQLRSLVMVILSVVLRHKNVAGPAEPDEWPTVVVQLPVYREHKVLDRLLSSVLRLDYPDSRWEVQVIDDSEGEEARLSREIVESYRGGPVPVAYLHRKERIGCKSGALNYGNRRTEAELIALFDSEFVPEPDFLRKTVPHFHDERVGAVQARFGYLNAESSPLTQIQGAIFDKMLCMEAAVRRLLGLPGLSLAGGGMWRKKTIEDLGGWQEEPFTSEDIDLSFRAHEAGWFIGYEPEQLSRAELPDTWLAYKIQQRKWARGVFRTFLDHWKSTFKLGFRSSILDLSLILLQGSLPLLVLVVIFTLVYVALGLPRTASWVASQIVLTLVLLIPFSLIEFVVTQKRLYDDWAERTRKLLRAVPLMVGLSVSLLAGFWDTVRGDRTEFIRTPKQGGSEVIQASGAKWLASATATTIVELALGLMALAAASLGGWRSYPESVAPLLFVGVCYLITAFRSLREIQAKRASVVRSAVPSG